jgi:hypothetical protein
VPTTSANYQTRKINVRMDWNPGPAEEKNECLEFYFCLQLASSGMGEHESDKNFEADTRGAEENPSSICLGSAHGTGAEQAAF